jgi:hypothetical protein
VLLRIFVEIIYGLFLCKHSSVGIVPVFLRFTEEYCFHLQFSSGSNALPCKWGFLVNFGPYTAVCMFIVPQQLEIFISTAVYDEFLMYCLLSKVCSVGLRGGVVLSEGQRVMK